MGMANLLELQAAKEHLSQVLENKHVHIVCIEQLEVALQ